jgi:hypothetical protein
MRVTVNLHITTGFALGFLRLTPLQATCCSLLPALMMTCTAAVLQVILARSSRVRKHAARDFLFQASCVPPSSSTRCRRGRGATRKVWISTSARGTSFGWLIFRCFRWHFTLAILLHISPCIQPDEERGAGHVVATHNPFTAPAPQCEKHLVEVSNHCHSLSRIVVIAGVGNTSSYLLDFPPLYAFPPTTTTSILPPPPFHETCCR